MEHGNSLEFLFCITKPISVKQRQGTQFPVFSRHDKLKQKINLNLKKFLKKIPYINKKIPRNKHQLAVKQL